MAQNEFDPENPNHHRLPGNSMFIDVTGGKFVARNVPPPPPTPQAQAANISPVVKPHETGGKSM